MNLEQKDYSVRVLLIYTLILTLPAAGWCDVTSTQPNTHLTPQDERNDLSTTRGLLKLLNFNTRDELNQPGLIEILQNKDGKEAGDKRATVSNSKAFKTRGKAEERRDKRKLTPLESPKEDCRAGEIQQVIRGKFTITGHLEPNIPNEGYQADSAAPVTAGDRVKGQRLGGSEESWQRLQPVVECGDDEMTLTVRRRRAAQLLLDRVNQSSVPLTRLPPRCGYSLHTSFKDLSLTAQYNACHVAHEDGGYVLPLLWRGIPVRMSCRASPMEPSPAGPWSLCCSPYGLTVGILGQSAAEELRINVRGEWTPLLVLVDQCGYTVDRREAEVVFAAPFLTCGITVKDENYKLSLQIGENVFTLACPIPPPEHLISSPNQPTEPFPWAPPFYLAPPYYPHPTFHHEDPDLDAGKPPKPVSSTPETTFDPMDSQAAQTPFEDYFSHFEGYRSPPSSDLQDSTKVDPSLQQKQEMLSSQQTSTRPSSPAALPLQTPSHAITQYYHYYHHPKIPLIYPTQPPEAPEAFSHPPPLPASPVSVQGTEYHPPWPYASYYFYYFPHVARGEAKRVPPLTSNQNSQIKNPSAENPKKDKVKAFENKITDQEKYDVPTPTIPGGVGKEGLSGEDIVNLPSSNLYHLPHPYQAYYLHPYYHYIYQLYSGAGLLSDSNPAFQTSSEQSLNLLPRASFPLKQHQSIQTTSQPIKPYDDYPNAAQHPFYHNHHLYYQQQASVQNQEKRPPNIMDSKDAPSTPTSASSSNHSWMDWLPPPAANAGFPSMHQHLQSFYSQYFSQQQDAFGRSLEKEEAAEEEAAEEEEGEEEEHNDEITDLLEVDLLTPSASPCAFGPVSDLCSSALGCCLFALNDCSEGQTLVFVDPDSVLDHPSEVLGQTGEHLFELQGVQSVQSAHSSDPGEAPPGFMRECHFTPGCPSEVKLTDPPPTITPVTLQLRLATDETFSSFHPKTHLPLGLIQGRPVYLEVRLLNPPEPDLVLLIHSCLAHMAPHSGWMVLYDSCFSWGESQLLPSPRSDPYHTRRLLISSFLSLHSKNPSEWEISQLEAAQIHFLCLTEVCSAADAGCAVSCSNSAEV